MRGLSPRQVRVLRLAPVVLAGEPGATHSVPVLCAPAHRPRTPEAHRPARPDHPPEHAAVRGRGEGPVAPHHARPG